jgi:hypothetical protein
LLWTSAASWEFLPIAPSLQAAPAAASAFCVASPQKSPLFEKIKWEHTVETLFSQIAVEFPGLAGEFCCLSLHRSQISKDL